jgi:large subunit ribosomal protein L30e
MADMIAELKKLMKEKKLVIGADETKKGLRVGKFQKVYLASNCGDLLKSDIEHYASIGGVAVVGTNLQNTEMGDICKKPFAISVMGLLK